MPIIRLFGPIDVVDSDGATYVPGSPMRGTLLTLLGLETGKIVDAERRLDTAWNREPPRRLNAGTDVANIDCGGDAAVLPPDTVREALREWRGANILVRSNRAEGGTSVAREAEELSAPDVARLAADALRASPGPPS